MVPLQSEEFYAAPEVRHETPLSLKHISASVGLGHSKSANATLHRWMKVNVGMDPSLAGIDPEAGL
jgi:hypothetical protein